MNEIEIFSSCAERLRNLDFPNVEQNISVIRTPFTIGEDFILLGKRHQGHLIALFPFSVEGHHALDGELKLSNGFKIAQVELHNPETGAPSPFLELSNIGNIDETLFGALLDEILKIIDVGFNDLVSLIKEILDKWKNMLSLDSERILSLNSLVGLFGELIFMDYLANEKGQDLFASWVGPLGNRHDFEFARNSIEVKSTMLKDSAMIVVHGVHQLEAYPGKEVYILRVKLELVPHGESVPKLISKLENSPLIIQEKLFEKLLKCGYKREHTELYASVCFQLVEIQLIPVNDKFPQITSHQLSQIDPNDRINQIEYTVNVSGLATRTGTAIADLDLDNLYE